MADLCVVTELCGPLGSNDALGSCGDGGRGGGRKTEREVELDRERKKWGERKKERCEKGRHPGVYCF